MNDPLASLRPLHLPAPVGWWPPAPGWWLLALLVLLLGGAAGWYYRRTALRRAALAELQRLQQHVTDDTALTAALNQLLRRVALARFPRTQVAALSGTAWLRFLEARASGFVSGPGRVLAAAPYQRGCAVDRVALVALARRWIRQACGRRA
jgi:hypothetical protein